MNRLSRFLKVTLKVCIPVFAAVSLSAQGVNKYIPVSKHVSNRVGETGLFPVSTSHTTVRTVRYTAVH